MKTNEDAFDSDDSEDLDTIGDEESVDEDAAELAQWEGDES